MNIYNKQLEMSNNVHIFTKNTNVKLIKYDKIEEKSFSGVI